MLWGLDQNEVYRSNENVVQENRNWNFQQVKSNYIVHEVDIDDINLIFPCGGREMINWFPQPGFEPGTSCSLVRCSTNWAIKARWYRSIRNTSKGSRLNPYFRGLFSDILECCSYLLNHDFKRCHLPSRKKPEMCVKSMA